MQRPTRILGAAIVAAAFAPGVAGKSTGSGPAKVLATYVVETGKPVASPVK